MAGGVFPFVVGLVLALLLRLIPGARAGRALAPFALGLGFLVAYWGLEGIAPWPPVASMQKLMYLALVAVVLGIGLQGAGAGAVRALAVLYPLGALGWLAERQIMAGPEAAFMLRLLLLWVAGTLALLLLDRAGRSGAEAGSVRAGTLLMVAALAGGPVALWGAFIGGALLSIATGAVAGGFLLVAYVDHVRSGKAPAFGAAGVIGLGGPWVATLFVVALYGPDVSPWALACLLLAFVVAAVASRAGTAETAGARALRPVLYGLAVAVPAVAAIVIAGAGYEGSGF